jgi:hypothetical protein
MPAFEGASNRPAVRLGLAAAAALCCLTISAGGALARATYTTFDAPDAVKQPSWFGTAAFYLNTQREIAGTYLDRHHDHNGFAWPRLRGFVRTPDGKITEFTVKRNFPTYVSGLNAYGVVAGYFQDSNLTPTRTRGFIRQPDGSISRFEVPSTAPGGTAVSGLNDRGDVTGTFDAGPVTSGFIRAADGTFATFSIDGAQSTNPCSINDAGVVAGYFGGSVYHGFVRSADGSISVFDPPGSSRVVGALINNRGEVAGAFQASDRDRQQHGFMLSPDGTFVVFDPPNSTITEVNGIDDRGRIVGEGGGYGFIRSPDGRMQLFKVPQSVITTVTAIRGDEAVGYSQPEGSNQHQLMNSFIRTHQH